MIRENIARQISLLFTALPAAVEPNRQTRNGGYRASRTTGSSRSVTRMQRQSVIKVSGEIGGAPPGRGSIMGDSPGTMLLALCSQVLVPASLLMGHSAAEQDQRLVPITTHTGNLLRTVSSAGEATKGTGSYAMALPITEVRGIVERVCARHDVLDACANRDLGTIITVLGAHGVTQGQIADLTGIGQGRLSEYMRHMRTPKASTTFEAFADGLDMPSAARQALGLAASKPGRSVVGPLSSRQASVPDVGLEYPGEPAQAARNVAALWRADLADEGMLARGVLEPAAWNDASLRWLVDPANGVRIGGEFADGVRVGVGDVERFRATVELFRQLDDRFGGGHARDALIQYLQSDGDRSGPGCREGRNDARRRRSPSAGA